MTRNARPQWTRSLAATACCLLAQPLVSLGDPSAVVADWRIVASERIGPVTHFSSRQELSQGIGRDRLVDAEVYLAEGFCTPGTLLSPGTANEVEIAWADKERTQVAFARIRHPGSQWRTLAGVRIGTTLKELEAIAGRVLTFGGFGWDYGGGLQWKERDGSLGLQLGTDLAAKVPDVHGAEIFGDRAVNSDHPVIRQMDIRVVAILLSWGAPFAEDECAAQPRGVKESKRSR